MSRRYMLLASSAFALVTLLVWNLVAHALDEDVEVKAEDSAIPVKLKERISELVAKSHPEAKTYFQGDELICEYRTQTFMIHAVDKGGTVDEKPFEEVGPRDGGFIIRIGTRMAPYQGAAGKPYGVQRARYWHYYRNEYQIPRSKRVVRLDMSYGSLTYDYRHNAKLFREIRTFCSAYGKPLFATRHRPEFKNVAWSDVESADEEWMYFRDLPDKK